MNNGKSVTNLLQNRLQYRGVGLEFISGKKLKLKDMDACFETMENGVRILATLDEYIAEFTYCTVDVNVVSCKAVLTPKGKVKDKVRTVTAYSSNESIGAVTHPNINDIRTNVLLAYRCERMA